MLPQTALIFVKLGLFLVSNGVDSRFIEYRNTQGVSKKVSIDLITKIKDADSKTPNYTTLTCELYSSGRKSIKLSINKAISIPYDPKQEFNVYIQCPNEKLKLTLPRFHIKNAKVGNNNLEPFIIDGLAIFDLEVSKETMIKVNGRRYANVKTIKVPAHELKKLTTFRVISNDGVTYKYPIKIYKKSIQASSKKIIVKAPKYLREARDTDLNFFFTSQNPTRKATNK